MTTANGAVSASESTRKFGTRGLSVWGGLVQEEYLAALKNWTTAVKIYKEMQDDIVIRTAIRAMTNPLLAAEFDVAPAGDTPGDEEAAAFLWDNMNKMVAQTWRSHVTDMLESIPFGFAIAEMVLEKRDDGRLWMANADPRGQETLRRWVFDKMERVEAFVQTHPTTGQELTIPASKLVHMTFEGRKGNPHGKPLLRSLYRTWKFLKNFENFEGIGVEHDVGNMPVYTDPEAEFMSSGDDTKIDDMLKGIRVDENVNARIPHGATLEPYGTGNKAYDIDTIITRKQKEILMMVHAQFLMLGMEAVGTQALVKGSQDFFTLGLKAVQQMMLESWQQQYVPFVFRFNSFPGMTAEPTILWEAPGKIDINEMLEAYVKGVAARVITPIPEDEDHFRPLMDLPDLPDGVVGSRDAPALSPAGFPGLAIDFRERVVV